MSDYSPEVLESAAQAVSKRFPAWTTREASDVIFTVLDAVDPVLRTQGAAAERERIDHEIDLAVLDATEQATNAERERWRARTAGLDAELAEVLSDWAKRWFASGEWPDA